MNKLMKSLWIVVAIVLATGAAVVAEEPAGAGQDAPMDLEVLPSSWSREQVSALMQAVGTSLGVRCSHCHAEDPDAPAPLPGQSPRLDYSLNTKPEKEVGRTMLRMTMELNAATRSPDDDASVEKISCFTCHRGEATPARDPADGWGRGSFALTEAGPEVPQRGRGGRRGGGPAAGAGGAPQN